MKKRLLHLFALVASAMMFLTQLVLKLSHVIREKKLLSIASWPKVLGKVSLALVCFVFVFSADAQSLLSLTAQQTNTCAGGSLGSVTLNPLAGLAPFTYDFFNQTFSSSLLNLGSAYDKRNGAFTNGTDLSAGSTVQKANGSLDNSIASSSALTDNGTYLRYEASFNFQASTRAYFGLLASSPLGPKTSLLIGFKITDGTLQFTCDGSTYSNAGTCDASVYYDFRMEKKGQNVFYYIKRTADADWILLGSATYSGTVTQFKIGAMYLVDNTANRGFNSKNWILTTNPPTTGLAAGTYTYSVLDALKHVASSTVTITESVPFNVSVQTNNTSSYNAHDGSLTLTTSGPAVAYVSKNSFNAGFNSASDINNFDLVNSGDFSVGSDLRGTVAVDNSGWANSITSKQQFTDNGILHFEGAFQFDAGASVMFGFASANKPIQNYGDLPVSFLYSNGALSYYINGVPTAVTGTYSAGVYYSFQIEKIGSLVKFYTKKDGEAWKVVGVAKYTGMDNVFKVGAQYNATSGSGGFNTDNWKVLESGTLTGLKAGNYNYQVVSVGGCSANVAFSIFDPLSFSATSNSASCYNYSDGKITVSAQGGKAPYSYSIDNGATYTTANTLDKLSAGSYQVVVKDTLGNTAAAQTISITQPAQVLAKITASGSTVICQGSTVSLAASSGASYLWSDGSTASYLQASASGNYSVKVTDATGCSNTSDVVSVVVNPLPNATITSGGSLVICSGSSVNLVAGGGTSYLWNNGATTASVTANTAGNYSVKVTDGNGCSATSAVSVLVNPLPTPAISASGSTTICAGSTVNLTSTGGVSYLWSNGSTNTVLQVGAAGNYSVTATDANGCSARSTPVAVVVNAAPAATITPAGSTKICGTGSVTLTATAGSSYLWSNGATTQSITTSASGNYSVTVKAANGCSATSTPTAVTVSAAPSVYVVASSANYLCSGVTLAANSPSAIAGYTWSNGATASSINLTKSNADGTYSVNVTDNNGCKSTAAGSYSFVKQNLLEAYSIVGLTSVNLTTYTTVASGSVGVTGSTGTITLGKYASVASAGAFVKAKTINVATPVNAPTQVKLAATVTLPAMQTNTSGCACSYGTGTVSGGLITLSSNYKSLTINAGSNVTLSGNIFGTITIGQGATVTFTNSSVNIDQLVVGTSKASATSALTTLHFAQNSAIKVSTSVYIYGRSRINAEENRITFYCGDSNPDAETFTVSGLDTKVAATVYVPVGTLSVTGTDATTTTNMTGLFIADKITSSGNKVVWNSWTCNAVAALTSAQSVTGAEMMEPLVEQVQQKLSVSVMPNPSPTEFVLVVNSSNNQAATIQIMDASGRMVETLSGVVPGAHVHVGSKLTSGNYYAQILQGSERVITKLIKTR